MRKNFDTLSGLVTEELGRELCSGDMFLFVGRNRKRAKILYWDGTGLCLFSKRLEKGRFAAPWSSASTQPLIWTTTELSLFLEGSELVGRVALSPSPFFPVPLGAPAV
jgi:transposase